MRLNEAREIHARLAELPWEQLTKHLDGAAKVNLDDLSALAKIAGTDFQIIRDLAIDRRWLAEMHAAPAVALVAQGQTLARAGHLRAPADSLAELKRPLERLTAILDAQHKALTRSLWDLNDQILDPAAGQSVRSLGEKRGQTRMLLFFLNRWQIEVGGALQSMNPGSRSHRSTSADADRLRRELKAVHERRTQLDEEHNRLGVQLVEGKLTGPPVRKTLRTLERALDKLGIAQTALSTELSALCSRGMSPWAAAGRLADTMSSSIEKEQGHLWTAPPNLLRAIKQGLAELRTAAQGH